MVKNMDTVTQTDSSNIAKSAFRVMAGGILSLSAGLINQVIIAAFYGAGAGMAAFLTAVVVPSYFEFVFLTGLTFVFVPAFVREETNGNEEDAWALVGTFLWVTIIVLFALAILGSVFSAQVIAITAPGFDPQESALAAKMLSVLMFCLPFSGLGSLCMSIQNARNRFFWPSFAGAVNSLANVGVLLLVAKPLGSMGLAWAYFASIVAQSAITIVPVVIHGWKKTLPLIDPRVLEMGRLVTPLILFGLITRASTMLQRYFASVLTAQGISYLGYANKISTVFMSLLASGIIAAIFPAMSRAYVQNGVKGMFEKNAYGMRLSFAVAMPAIMIASALTVPMVRILFERGAFTAADTLGVAQIIFISLIGDVLFRMIANINQRASYVLKDTLMPSVVASAAMILYALTGKFVAARWGYTGLAFLGAMNQGLTVLLVCIFLFRKASNVALGKTAQKIGEYILASVAAYLAGRFGQSIMPLAPAVLQLAVGGALGLAVYVLVLYFRDREILMALLEMFGFRRVMGQLQFFRSRYEKTNSYLLATRNKGK